MNGSPARRIVAAAASLALVVLGSAGAARAQGTGLHVEDRTFLLFAMETDMSQVRLGELGMEKAQDEEVRRFAQRMVDYHRQSHDHLLDIARRHGIEPLQGIGPVVQRMLDDLRPLSGREFDIEYMADTVIHHNTAYYRYEHAKNHGLDRELRRLAGRQAEDIEMHHNAALRLIKMRQRRQAG
jgi:putative membrane protein